MTAPLEFAAMDPLGTPATCLLCGAYFSPEGYSERFKPELLPGMPAGGFAPAIVVEDRHAGFVCPGCFGDGGEALALSMRRGAKRLRVLAGSLERREGT